MNKSVRVILLDEADNEYKKLNGAVGQQIKEGKKSTDEMRLLRSIKQKIEFIKENPQYGIHIPKNKIPKDYINKYDVNNLWKVNLSGAWRMIYTIRGSEIEIIALILDIINHKKYNKKFGYRKN